MTSERASSELTGRVALVTGGAQGIGAAIADRLAAAGATVVVGDLRSPTDAANGTLPLDVSDEASVAAAIEAVVATHERLDIVVNNAGIMFEQPVQDQTLADWNRMLAVNLTGPFLIAKHAAAHLAADGDSNQGGTIVNIGSIEGYVCNPNHTAYAASKGGVHGLTKALAVDLGPQGIRCNAVAPGWIDTELNASYVDTHPDRDAVVEALAELHPIGHIGDPADVGDVVVSARPSLPDILR